MLHCGAGGLCAKIGLKLRNPPGALDDSPHQNWMLPRARKCRYEPAPLRRRATSRGRGALLRSPRQRPGLRTMTRRRGRRRTTGRTREHPGGRCVQRAATRERRQRARGYEQKRRPMANRSEREEHASTLTHIWTAARLRRRTPAIAAKSTSNRRRFEMGEIVWLCEPCPKRVSSTREPVTLTWIWPAHANGHGVCLCRDPFVVNSAGWPRSRQGLTVELSRCFLTRL